MFGPVRRRRSSKLTWAVALLAAPVLSACGQTLAAPAPRVASGPFTAGTVSCSGVSVFPSPGSLTASPTTQVSFRNVHPSQLSGATLAVVGSVSGPHLGRFVADSDGEGTSFYPTLPFTPGETVTVTTALPICGGSGDSAAFQVARPAPPSKAAPPQTPAKPTAPQLQSFPSAPQLKPPVLQVTKSDPSSEGDFLLAPKGGPAAGGPMIVNGSGQLVWFDPLPLGVNSSDLRVQTYAGQPVLTWWQGQVTDGHGVGEDVIMNEHYQVVAVVKAGNGYSADLHEFVLGPGQTAWVTAFDAIGWDLSSVGGPRDGAVYDGIVQELDVRTGNVLFQWDSLDHVGVGLSSVAYSARTGFPYDYFHVNSIDPSGYGTVLVSSRNTSALYLADVQTGALIWRLGGKRSQFAMGSGTSFALQHDAELHGDSVVTLFDDEDTQTGGLPARALELRLDLARHTASLVWAYNGPNNVVVPNQGNVQTIADGNVVVGWGAGTYTTEMTTSGQLLFQANFTGPVNSYRAYRSVWNGQPTTLPALALRGSGAGLEAYASWNGATDVSAWEILGGPSTSGLTPIVTHSATGFETGLPLRSHPAYVEVEALGAGGRVLATSAPVRSA